MFAVKAGVSLLFSSEIIESNKVALLIEYDGSDYHGWQIQTKPPVRTVQGEVEKALSYVANEPVKVFCAGRTDAGVHATAQLVHFETSAKRSEVSWVKGVNTNLPNDVVVRWAKPVDDDFHARFTATARTYRYVIANQAVGSAILDRKVTLIKDALDVAAMHEAGQHLLGENDFSAYRGASCQSNSPFRCIEYLKVEQKGQFVVMEVCANAFLLHMVRNIMGVLIEIGLGNKPIGWSRDVLLTKDRKQAAKTAPPHGLYLVDARYPEHYGLSQAVLGPIFL